MERQKFITLPQWFQDRGFSFKMASDSARSVDLEASRYLQMASEIAFYNADALNRVLLYEAEGCIEVEDVPNNTPTITTVEEAAIVRGGIDGQLLGKLVKLCAQLNVPNALKNVSLREDAYNALYGPVHCSAIQTLPALAAAAANRVWIKLCQAAGLQPPKKPRFAYPVVKGVDMQDKRDPDLFCPICGETHYTWTEKEGGEIEYIGHDDEWSCWCESKFAAMVPYPRYPRVF